MSPALIGGRPPRHALVAMARASAKRHGLPPSLYVRQIDRESGFNPHARSPMGAQGIAQLSPDTARRIAVNPWDPAAALDAGAKLMAGYWRTYQAQGRSSREAYRLALAAYNAGTGAVARHGGVPPYEETESYVAGILGGSES